MAKIENLQELIAAINSKNTAKFDEKIITEKYNEALKESVVIDEKTKNATALRAVYSYFQKSSEKLSKAKKIRILMVGYAGKNDNRAKLDNAKRMWLERKEDAIAAYPKNMFDNEGNLMFPPGKFSKIPQRVPEQVTSSGIGIMLDGNNMPQKPIVFSVRSGDVVDKMYKCHEMGIYEMFVTSDSYAENSDGIAEGKAIEFLSLGNSSVDEKSLLATLVNAFPAKYKIGPEGFPKLLAEMAADQKFSLAKGLALVDCIMTDMLPSKKGYSSSISSAGELDTDTVMYDCYIPSRLKVMDKFGNGSEVFVVGSIYKGNNDDKARLNAWAVIPHPDKSLPPQPKSSQDVSEKEVFGEDTKLAGEEYNGEEING
jgi:hypothetical protein